VSAFTQAVSTALIDSLWQGAGVGLLAWLALAMLRNRPAHLRYAVSCVALLVLTLLPLLTVATLWTWAGAPRSDEAGAGALLSSAASRAANMPQTMLQVWWVPDSPRVLWLEQIQRWALPVWSAGVLLFSIRLAWGCRHSFILRRGDPCPDAGVLSMVADLARRIGVTRRLSVLVSSVADGPAVVGWRRPVLLLPPAAAMGLTTEQLQAVLAHELAHIRRNDYLVNLFQIAAETLFFYHPVVWWISKQIRIERELCCDDVAVESCGDPVGYARALTALARHQLASPAVAMAATGGSLLHRVQRLVGAVPREYGPARTPGVLAASLVVACVLLNLDWLQAFGEQQVPADQPRFEVASVKVNTLNNGLVSCCGPRGRFTAMGMSLGGLIRSAYQVQEFQIVNGPDWIDSTKFDIVATEPENVARPAPGTPGPGPQQLMLRALLEERFGLAVHKETRELPVYALVLARSDGRLGPDLRRSTTDCTGSAARGRAAGPSANAGPWQSNPCGTSVGPGLIIAGARTMTQIATAFSMLTNTGSSLNRLVVDRTGLEGTFDLMLRFTPENIPNFGPGGPPPGLPAIDPNGPSIFTAVQEQLGLKLDSQRGPVEVLVIDRVSQPSEN
jgi:uncharacterized protein (TIGR03435 family)